MNRKFALNLSTCLLILAVNLAYVPSAKANFFSNPYGTSKFGDIPHANKPTVPYAPKLSYIETYYSNTTNYLYYASFYTPGTTNMQYYLSMDSHGSGFWAYILPGTYDITFSSLDIDYSVYDAGCYDSGNGFGTCTITNVPIDASCNNFAVYYFH